MNDYSCVFTVAVGYNTHDGLKDGAADKTAFVTVQAVTDVDATLVAAQMVASVHDVMPTSTTILAVAA